jgi:hypothetical protein
MPSRSRAAGLGSGSLRLAFASVERKASSQLGNDFPFDKAVVKRQALALALFRHTSR